MVLNAHGDPGLNPTHSHFPIPLPISLQLISCLPSLSCPFKGEKPKNKSLKRNKGSLLNLNTSSRNSRCVCDRVCVVSCCTFAVFAIEGQGEAGRAGALVG